MSSSYWNYEDDENIICPYCGEEYEPSYEDTYIGDDCVDCYTEDTNTYTLARNVARISQCMAIKPGGNTTPKRLTEKRQGKKSKICKNRREYEVYK